MTTETPTMDQDEIFKTLDEYSWDKDQEFQGGLTAILGPNPQPSQIQDLTIRAQCFYLSRKLSVPINFDAYKSHLASIASKELLSRPEITSPSQRAQTTSTNIHAVDPSTNDPKMAPYPKPFAEIVELITSGKPIPGIREIKTVDRPEKASKPVLPKRRKPWEKDVPQAQIDGLIGGLFGDERDVHIRQELPEDA